MPLAGLKEQCQVILELFEPESMLLGAESPALNQAFAIDPDLASQAKYDMLL